MGTHKNTREQKLSTEFHPYTYPTSRIAAMHGIKSAAAAALSCQA
jgi:hypothetical protein